jgi:hypothetical protein
MAASATRNYGHLSVTNYRRICTDHDFMSQQSGRTRLKHYQALEHFFYDVLWGINELFHNQTNVRRCAAALIYGSI